MATPDSFVETRTPRAVGWVREDLADVGLEPFWGPLRPMPGASGRGGVGVLQVGASELVVRPYRRGGVLAPILSDRYLAPSRALAELAVLLELQRQGVPVVAPVAAVARRRGLFWRLRLCTERLVDARTMPQFLADFSSARRRAVEAVGAAVRLAFAAGLRHPDLHPDNVLCRADGAGVHAVLVDLDRARMDAPLPPRARDGMLARMQRYINKHRERLPAAPSRAETMRFLRSLGLERAERHALWRRLAKSA